MLRGQNVYAVTANVFPYTPVSMPYPALCLAVTERVGVPFHLVINPVSIPIASFPRAPRDRGAVRAAPRTAGRHPGHVLPVLSRVLGRRVAVPRVGRAVSPRGRPAVETASLLAQYVVSQLAFSAACAAGPIVFGGAALRRRYRMSPPATLPIRTPATSATSHVTAPASTVRARMGVVGWLVCAYCAVAVVWELVFILSIERV